MVTIDIGFTYLLFFFN